MERRKIIAFGDFGHRTFHKGFWSFCHSLNALDSMKCVAAVKRKGEVQEEDICMKFLTSFSLMKKEVSEDPFILLLAKVVEVLCILIVLI
ncbi:unnamed protein product [Trifolium pratense]|uniref:Uncharacterized protein n=2 Tax=Trifolium pratense TaxID=57577 RepID=A0ACB0KKC2_TRIPR|nr:unnamed protein product [Trifolium pratense]